MTAFCSYPTFSMNPANPGWPNLLATLFSPLGRWLMSFTKNYPNRIHEMRHVTCTSQGAHRSGCFLEEVHRRHIRFRPCTGDDGRRTVQRIWDGVSNHRDGL